MRRGCWSLVLLAGCWMSRGSEPGPDPNAPPQGDRIDAGPDTTPCPAGLQRVDAGCAAWVQAGTTPVQCSGHSATALRDGRLLVVGRCALQVDGEEAESATVLLYDPVADRWTSTRDLLEGVTRHTATRLVDGRVLVNGGVDADGALRDQAMIFDPSRDEWHAVSPLSTARADHTTVVLTDGRVLVTGGTMALGWRPDDDEITASTEVFDPVAETWAPAAPAPDAWRNAGATVVDGSVLVIGGNRRSQVSAEVLRYDPSSDRWSREQSIPHAASGPAVIRDGDRVAVLGDPHLYGRTTTDDVWSSVTLEWGYQSCLVVLRPGRWLIIGDDPYMGDPLPTLIVDDGAMRQTANHAGSYWMGAATLTVLADGRALAVGGGAELYVESP